METTRKCLCSTYLMGYDAWEVVLQQRIVTRGYGRVFPHNHRSVSAAFTRACDELKIEDLHFHDASRGTSRLFEARRVLASESRGDRRPCRASRI